MEVENCNYAYQYQGQINEEMFYSQDSMSPPSANSAAYCSNYMDQNAQMWSNTIHPFHASMHWTQYSDINQHGVKMPTMSAHSYAIARRNERERNRVRHINSTFERLRKHLPPTGRKRKLSKVDTLRTAIRYIEHLQDILDQSEPVTVKKEDDDSRLSASPSLENTRKVKREKNNNENRSAVLSSQDSSDSFISCCRYSENKDNSLTVQNSQYNSQSSAHIIKGGDLNDNSRTSSPDFTDEDCSWTDSVF